MQNAPTEHSAIHLTCIKLLFVFKAFVLPIFEWPLKTGFTVFYMIELIFLSFYLTKGIAHLSFVASFMGIYWKLAKPNGEMFSIDQICLKKVPS